MAESTAHVILTNFTAGIFSPRLNARVDQEKYDNALEEGRNIFIHPHGGAARRDGFIFVSEAKYSSYKSRLVPFQFNTEQAYILEFSCNGTTGVMRVKRDGGYVSIDGPDLIANGEFTADTSHWDAVNSASLAAVTGGASGRCLGITENGADNPAASQSVAVEPEQLYRVNLHAMAGTEDEYRVVLKDETTGVTIFTSDWEIASGDWCHESTYQAYTPFGCKTMGIEIQTRAAAGDGTIMFFDFVACVQANTPYEIETPYTTEESLSLIDWCQSADTMYIACRGLPPQKLTREDHDDWSIFVHDTNGPWDEGAEYTGTLQPSAATGDITITASAAETFSDTDVNRLVTIKGATKWGYARITSVTSGLVVNATVIEDFDGTGASSDWKLGIWNNEIGWPEKVTFFESRLCYARQQYNPQHLRWSRSEKYDDFTISDPIVADDSVALTIVGNEVNSIQWMLSSLDFLVGTTGGEWVIKGGGSSKVLNPTDIISRRQTGRGSADVNAIYVGSSIVFVQRGGGVVRELAYSLDVDKYTDRDLSIISEHLTRDTAIVQWEYQQSPDSILWCILADGTLATMTYLNEHDVQAWAEQVTDGKVESIAVIPGDDDQVWISVRRERKYPGWNIEIIDNTPGDQHHGNTGKAGDTFVLKEGANFSSGFVVEGRNDDGDNVFFLYSGAVELGAADADKTITFAFSPAGDQIEPVWTGTGELDPNWTELATATQVFRSTEVLAPRFSLGRETDMWSKIESLKDAFFVDSGLTYSGEATKTLSNIGHLEGRTVQILADGGVEVDSVVENGRVYIQTASSKVHIGLGYNTDIKTLDLNLTTQTGTIQGRKKKIEKCIARVFETNSFKGGQDEDHLVDTLLRTDDTPGGEPVPPQTDDVDIDAGWSSDRHAQVLIRQDKPLPMTLLGIMFTVSITED